MNVMIWQQAAENEGSLRINGKSLMENIEISS